MLTFRVSFVSDNYWDYVYKTPPAVTTGPTANRGTASLVLLLSGDVTESLSCRPPTVCCTSSPANGH